MSDEAERLRDLIENWMAWHGSHADFSAFKDEKIGTGEGAQVYGQGHYLADRHGTSKYYMDQNTRKHNSQIKGHTHTFNGHDASELYYYAGGMFSNIDQAERLAKNRDNPDLDQKMLDTIGREHHDEKGRLASLARDLGVPEDLHNKMTSLHAQVLSSALSDILHSSPSAKVFKYDILADTSHHYSLRQAKKEAGLSQLHNGFDYDDDDNDDVKSRADELADTVYMDLAPLIDKVEKIDVQQHPGRMYRVAVAADRDKMIDWDLPIKNHPQHVLDKVEDILPVDLESFNDDDTGQNLYKGITFHAEKVLSDPDFREEMNVDPAISAAYDAANTPKAQRKIAATLASKMLMEAGVPGIKYQDAGSRGRTTVKTTIDGHDVKSAEALKILNSSPGATMALTPLMTSYRHAPAPQSHDDITRQIAIWVLSERPGTHAYNEARLAEQWWAKNQHRVQFTHDRGSFNYVIFDPNIIKIVKKYDIDGNLVEDNTVHLKAVDHDPFKE